MNLWPTSSSLLHYVQLISTSLILIMDLWLLPTLLCLQIMTKNYTNINFWSSLFRWLWIFDFFPLLCACKSWQKNYININLWSSLFCWLWIFDFYSGRSLIFNGVIHTSIDFQIHLCETLTASLWIFHLHYLFATCSLYHLHPPKS